MGGIADYSGSLLLQMPVSQRTEVSIRKRQDSTYRIRSVHADGKAYHFTLVYDLPESLSLQETGERIRRIEGGDWAAYVLGCFVILSKEKGIRFSGADIDIFSDVPLGKGVSSSASIEIATLQAISKAYGLLPGELELPLLAQRVENAIVGAACGLMDQLAVHFGKKDSLVPIICQPHTVGAAVPVHPDISFSGIDSGVRHVVSGAGYADVRAAAFMAYSVIARREGLSGEDLSRLSQAGRLGELPWGGYLANIPVSVFEQHYASHLPDEMTGSDFLRSFGFSIDRETKIEPSKVYRLLASARHPVYEQQRVALFLKLLEGYGQEVNKAANLQWMGELMYQSHASYSAVGLGNEATDRIVERARTAGTARGVYGARVSGGGSGGTVVVLSGGQAGKEAVWSLYQECQEKFGKKLFFFTGSSDGSLTLNQ
jgi:L-arabinokinase